MMSRSESSTKILVDKEIGKRFEEYNPGVYKAIVREWKLYMEGQLSKHDFFCEVATFIPTYYLDVLLQLRTLADEVVDTADASPSA